MNALLEEDDEVPLFISGCTTNQTKFYDRFDAIVLLTASKNVVLERLA